MLEFLKMKNFYPEQYIRDNNYQINHNYLKEQFSDCDEILLKIKQVINNSDYTLGKNVDEVESLIAKECQTKYAIGVGSGTDALMLSLKVLGVGPGDEVITSTYTFYATVGAIVTAGAKPIFCDCKEDYNIDVDQIESKITAKTKAIIPIHWTGKPCNMGPLKDISQKFEIPIVEDACHALQAEYFGKRCGSFGDLGCFSFHPLKNLNVWGDGGIIVTDNKSYSDQLKLIRNHGLIDRDTCLQFSYNSRLDTIQAVVAKHLIENKLANITKTRIENAQTYDQLLTDIPEITVQKRLPNNKEVFHLYTFQAKKRNKLASYLQENGIDAKIHYPIPMHMQPAAKKFNYKKGDFPVAEKLSASTISLPVHEYVSKEAIYNISNLIKEFFK